jgi:hypothetical protein
VIGPSATTGTKTQDEECGNENYCVLGQCKTHSSVNISDGNIIPDTSSKITCVLKFAVSLCLKNSKWQYQLLNALCDSGSSGTLIREEVLPYHSCVREGTNKNRGTKVGQFTTNKTTTCLIQPPQLAPI